MKTRKFARLLSAGLSVAALAAVPAAVAHAAPGTSGPKPEQQEDNQTQQDCQAYANNDWYYGSGLLDLNLSHISALNGVSIIGQSSYTEKNDAQNNCKQDNWTAQQQQKEKEHQNQNH